MADEGFTPSTEQIRDVAILGAMYAAGGEENLDLEEFKAMFDRWLKAHDAEVAANALEDLTNSKIMDGQAGLRHQINNRAKIIRKVGNG